MNQNASGLKKFERCGSATYQPWLRYGAVAMAREPSPLNCLPTPKSTHTLQVVEKSCPVSLR